MHALAETPPDPPRPEAPSWTEPAASRLSQAQVRRYLRFLGAARDVVDDLVQDTMLAAWRHGRGDAPPLPWLLATARNALRMHWRARGRRRELADLDRLDRAWVEQVGDDAGEARRAALRDCLASLPERSRRLIALRYGEGRARDAIAAELGLGAEGVKTLLARVRQALGDCVRRRTNDA